MRAGFGDAVLHLPTSCGLEVLQLLRQFLHGGGGEERGLVVRVCHRAEKGIRDRLEGTFGERQAG